MAAEAGDETSAAYYLEVLAAVAGQQDNPQRAVRLLAAARSILEARGSGWLHSSVPRHRTTIWSAPRCPAWLSCSSAEFSNLVLVTRQTT